jgi:DNA (cytosine-5)-methyltransferase 1
VAVPAPASSGRCTSSTSAGHLPTRRHVDIAINHDAEAVAMHKANHPATQHLCQNIWKVDPAHAAARLGRAAAGAGLVQPGLHPSHSKPRAASRSERGRRDLGWMVVRWLDAWPPRVFILENVEEFQDWCDLIDRGDGKLVPDPDRKGETFKRWCREIRKRGYQAGVRRAPGLQERHADPPEAAVHHRPQRRPADRLAGADA